MFAFLKKLFGKADVNQDGRVDRKDVKIAADAVVATAKTTAAKAKGAARNKIARAKKAAAKPQ